MSLSREQLLFAEIAKAMKKTVARQAIGMGTFLPASIPSMSEQADG